MSDLKKNYELAFHINPNLEESRISQIKSELEQKLVSGGATITYTKEPERQHLSYDINHNANSYFGYIQFNTEDATVLAPVEEYIKLNPDVIRSIILRLPSDTQRNQAMMRQMKAKERLEKKAKAVPKMPAAENKELDKELENIIEKL